jgi:hypothetical protein
MSVAIRLQVLILIRRHITSTINPSSLNKIEVLDLRNGKLCWDFCSVMCFHGPHNEGVA